MLIDEDRLDATVDALRGELIAAIQELVRIPTENLPPGGNERAGQEYLARRLRDLGLDVELYALADVPGLTEQASYWPGRDYRDRPNLTAVWRGRGGGRSLLLTGHMDTVPRGSAAWSVDPFGGLHKDGRIYGLGAIDMKGSPGGLYAGDPGVAAVGRAPARAIWCLKAWSTRSSAALTAPSPGGCTAPRLTPRSWSRAPGWTSIRPRAGSASPTSSSRGQARSWRSARGTASRARLRSSCCTFSPT